MLREPKVIEPHQRHIPRNLFPQTRQNLMTYQSSMIIAREQSSRSPLSLEQIPQNLQAVSPATLGTRYCGKDKSPF